MALMAARDSVMREVWDVLFDVPFIIRPALRSTYMYARDKDVSILPNTVRTVNSRYKHTQYKHILVISMPLVAPPYM